MYKILIILTILFLSSCKSNSIYFDAHNFELYEGLKKTIKQSPIFLNFLQENKVEYDGLRFLKWEDNFCSKATFYFEEDITNETIIFCKKNKSKEQLRFNNIKELNDKDSKYIDVSVTQKIDNYIIATVYLKTIGVESRKLILLYKVNPDLISFKELSSKKPTI